MTIKNINKLIIGKNGINWLMAAETSFILESNVFIKESDNYKYAQRGINAKKWSEQLLGASKKVKSLIVELRKQLVI